MWLITLESTKRMAAILLVLAAALLIHAMEAEASLSLLEKQKILDYHNYHRALHHTRQLLWNVSLSEAAQDVAKDCDPKEEQGQNFYYYNKNEVTEDIEERIPLEHGPQDRTVSSILQPINFSLTAEVGCGHQRCAKLTLDGGIRVFDADFYVCKFSPVYDIYDNHPANKPCSKDSSSCPTEVPHCVQFTSAVLHMNVTGLSYCASSMKPPLVPLDGHSVKAVQRVVNKVLPTHGSLAGGTLMTLIGIGFSSNQYSGGNYVLLKSVSSEVPCDVVTYKSNEGEIQCVTRETIVLRGSVTFNITVFSSDGSGFEPVESRHVFTYDNRFTPYLEQLDPPALGCGQTVILSGKFYSSTFSDPADSNQHDQFVQILVGGRPCSPMDENGTMYGAISDRSGIYTSIECRPECQVASMNVTAVLAKRGNSLVREEDYVCSMDNNLQPYCLQMYADIDSVFPMRGSTEGGTRIEIAMNLNFSYSPSEVRVTAGGVPCVDVSTNSSETGHIQCTTTRPINANVSIYPGHRGVSVEIHPDLLSFDDMLLSRPSSLVKVKFVHESLMFCNGQIPSVSNTSSQRLSLRADGYFIPPKTSLYTFNILSVTGESQLYLVHNSSGPVLVASSRSGSLHGWNRTQSQLSSPVILQESIPYQFIVLGRIYYRPSFFLGVGAKVHSVPYNSRPYVADQEKQKIEIQSTVVKEKQAVKIEVVPQVQTLQLTMSISNITQGHVPSWNICSPFTLNVIVEGNITDTLSLSLGTSASEMEAILNNLTVIQDTGMMFVRTNNDSISFVFLPKSIFRTTSLLSLPGLALDDSSATTLSCFDTPTSTNYSVMAAMAVKQNLTLAEGFQVGYNNTHSSSRFTSVLPLNVSQEELEYEMNELLKWVCEYNTPSLSVLYSNSFEGNHTEADNSTAFCGRKSKKSPGVIWEDTDGLGIDHYICFAHCGVFPGLAVGLRYSAIVPRENTYTLIQVNTSFLINNMSSAGVDGDWSEYNCFSVKADYDVDSFVESDLRQRYPDCMQKTCTDYNTVFTSIEFQPSEDFWIDDVYIASQKVIVSRLRAPLSSNRVKISQVTIQGGVLSQPVLKVTSLPEPNSTSDLFGFESIRGGYTAVLALYTVTFTVLECGYGMDLLNGFYVAPHSLPLRIEQVESASEPVGGTFSVQLDSSRVLDLLPSNISAAGFQLFLEHYFPEEGEFLVERLGTCAGFRWEIEWSSRGGDFPEIVATGQDLRGTNVNISSSTLRHGGVWLRPIRGDMLRTVAQEPQVDVIINGVPSSCSSENCGFQFDSHITPTVLTVSPARGQEGTIVAVTGTNFPSDPSQLTITIGRAKCSIIGTSGSTVTCTASRHVAGSFRVRVLVDGVGYSAGEVCFLYLLSLHSVTPSAGSIAGGNEVTVTGNGFLEFSKAYTLDTPWTYRGIGFPTASSLAGLDICQSEELFHRSLQFLIGNFNYQENVTEGIRDKLMSDILDKNYSECFDSNDTDYENCSINIRSLTEYLQNLSHFALFSVYIGGSPCIVTESTINSLNCTTLFADPGLLNVTVSVFSETVTLEKAFWASPVHAPWVTSIQPTTVGVSGGDTTLTLSTNITGSIDGNTGSDLLGVFVGSEPCDNVTKRNDSSILCTVRPHPPGVFLVWIVTEKGVAVTIEALELFNEPSAFKWEETLVNSSVLPLFEYRLRVGLKASVQGSVAGGTEIVIEGGIFVYGFTRVYVGGSLARIVRFSELELVCVLPSTRTTTVNVLGTRRAGERFRLLWDYTNMTVQVGDTVMWDWRGGDTLATPFQVQLYITNQILSNFARVENTSIGQSRTNATEYRYTFYSEGTYYYLANVTGHSGSHDSTEVHRGVINVTRLQTHLPAFNVCVGDTGVFGKYYCTNESPSSFVERHPSPGNCTTLETIDRCLGGLNGTSLQVPFILYSPLSTPIVEYVDPQEGVVSETVFAIHGTGFSSDVTLNTVSFGPVPCQVISASITTLECKVGSNSALTPIAWKHYFLSLLVLENNTGYAFIRRPTKARIKIVPKILAISPLHGSVKGGTDLVITGSTFSFNTKFTVGIPCKILRLTPTEIICRTLEVEPHGQTLTSNISICLVQMRSHICTQSEGIQFTYSRDHTPNVTSLSLHYTVSSTSIILYLYGDQFSDIYQWNLIKVGNHSCNITSFNQTLIVCTFPVLPVSYYPLSFIVCNASSTLCLGYADTPGSHTNIPIHGFVSKVSPSSGSIFGGTELTIDGSGFHEGTNPFALTVSIGNSTCIVTSINVTTVKCDTAPQLNTIDLPQLVEISVNKISFHNENVTFTFSSATVLNVTSIEPSSGQVGDLVSLTGTMLGAEKFSVDDITVEIGGSKCTVAAITSYSSIVCSLGANIVGNYSLSIHIHSHGFGRIVGGITFEYVLRLYNISDTAGSFAGGNAITVHGAGFDPRDSKVLVCGRVCSRFWRLSNLTQIVCRVPRASLLLAYDQICDVEVKSRKITLLLVNGYNYSVALTPLVESINRSRGGTAGGSVVQITGEGFTSSAARVTIARSMCDVKEQNDTSIICITGASSRTVRRVVQVFVSGKGFSWTRAYFWYVDLWSSRFTWKNHTLPSQGDLVVISRGQTLVLDLVTPILSIVVIQGGELIFDEEAEDNQVGLHTQRLLIDSQGRLVIGTEKRPFLAKTELVLYGHVLSTELPMYGTKNIALREGEISVHGHPINATWTRLISTALPGASTIYLRDWVSWKASGKIVIASTSFSQGENEVRDISSVYPGLQGSVVVLTKPLEFEHISIRQIIAGRLIDTSAEVGYLTRNIVFRGDTNENLRETVTGCDREFRPGPYQVQTCFRGRFGDEVRGDYFGGHIFVQAATPNINQVAVKLSFVEITSFGQAYRLGRYPINFHLNGNMSGSYVKGCSIHRTFNRAVSILNTDHLLVEKNVVYDTLGHGFSLDDGTEQYNTIQDNLGVFIKPSTTSLNAADMFPSVFWVVNANNIVRRNVAAGSSHYGFWYRGSQYGSASSSHCVQKWPVLEFEENSAHSLGLYGLWILRHFPSYSGSCADNRHAPSHFNRLLSWRNNRGVSSVYCGSVQVRDSVILDSVTGGIEFTELLSVWGDNGAMVSNSLIVGHSLISEAGFCTLHGLTVPSSYHLTVTNVTFVGFDTGACYPIHSCATPCPLHQGGFETRYEMITMVNVSQVTKWNWEHEHIHYDMDGTLTGTGRPSILLPRNELLDSSECKVHPMSSLGVVAGSICNGTIKFGRMVIFNPQPRSLRLTYLNVSNDFGTITLPYKLERNARFGFFRYMSVLQVNTTSYHGYRLTWLGGETFTNVSYRIQTSGIAQSDYFLFSQEFPQPLDEVEIQEGTASDLDEFLLEDSSLASHGDYTLSSNGTLLSYFIRGSRYTSIRARRCFYEGCTVPLLPAGTPPSPPQRSNNSQLWSSYSSWVGNEVPRDGQDCVISNLYLLLDVAHVKCEKLELIGSTLEVLDGEDRIIQATYIIVHGGAKLVAGYPGIPFSAKLRIVLHGDSTSPELRVGSSPPISSRTIAVFGELILTAPPIVTRTWTTLLATAEEGTSFLSLSQRVGWLSGDVIVITSSSYDPYQSEVHTVESISPDGLTLVLSDTLQFSHEGRNDTLKYIGAEVGYLSRRITIENENPQTAKDQLFGCRLLVSQSFPHQGVVSLSGVGFRGCGQQGYRDDYDTRFALVFLNLMQVDVRSNVTQCSFYNGYSTAIGVLNSNGISVEDNVIHGTIGASMTLRGTGLIVTHNLASLAQYVGMFQSVVQRHNPDWTANYRIERSSANLVFEYNSAAGGAMACFHINGENQNEEGSVLVMRNNVGHSCLHGVHLGYTDGHATGSKFENFTLSHCYFFGFFSYSPASIVISNSVFVNNVAAIFASVIGPSSLTHTVGEKSVIITNTVIVSRLNTTRCSLSEPPIVAHQNSDGIQSPSGGHVGVIIPTFLSGHGPFPFGSWHRVTSYPAINGSTSITNVTFMNFDCRSDSGEEDVLLMTNPSSEDANHPVYLSGIADSLCANKSKLFIHRPSIGLANPSGCGDMYCDGLKSVLVKDRDGSFTGRLGYPHYIIPFAELNWDGPDQRAGIGDFRLPDKMLTNPDGSRINIKNAYPLKGIVRGETFGRGDDCSFVSEWNAYLCQKLDYLMMVIESLDADTEVRRLSPVAYGANGFVNLVNGPMDHGLCDGYNCQERISSFYLLVAEGFNYTLAFTGNNPQKMALHLLQAGADQAVVVAIIYNNPQRLDISVETNGVDSYVVPNNAFLESGNLNYREGEAAGFMPSLSDSHGSNFYDRISEKLFITLRGKRPVKILTSPVVLLTLSLSVSVDDFFDETELIRNPAFLLEIPGDRIRLVSVTRETARRRKRQTNNLQTILVSFEIGDSPFLLYDISSSITVTCPTTSPSNSPGLVVGSNTCSLNSSHSSNSQPDISSSLCSNSSTLHHVGSNSSSNFTYYSSVASYLVDALQAGMLNYSIGSFSLQAPVDSVVDPTGGVRATATSRGNASNSSLTFAELQQLLQNLNSNSSTGAVTYTIPCYLIVRQLASAIAVEGLRVTSESVIKLAMLTCDQTLCTRLGLDETWAATVSARTKPEGAFLTGTVANFSEGISSFDELVFSRPGSYLLAFAVSYPAEVNIFVVAPSPVVILERQLAIVVVQQPQQGNDTFPLYPYPAVQLADPLNGYTVVSDHTWRNTMWYAEASVTGSGQESAVRVPVASGVATFDNLQVTSAGDYQLEFSVYQLAEGSDVKLDTMTVTSSRFKVLALSVLSITYTYNISFSTVAGSQDQFLSILRDGFLKQYDYVEVVNATLSSAGEGIVVVMYIAATDPTLLHRIVFDITFNKVYFIFVYNGIDYIPSNVAIDWRPPPNDEGNNFSISILVICILAIPYCFTLCVGLCCLCWRVGKKAKKRSKISVTNVVITNNVESSWVCEGREDEIPLTSVHASVATDNIEDKVAPSAPPIFYTCPLPMKKETTCTLMVEEF